MIKQLVLKSRSVRTFRKGGKITRADLIDIINTARFCPSAINLQPLKYKVVDDAATCAKLTRMTRWGSLIKDAELPPKGKGPCGYILVCSDDSITRSIEFSRIDAGIASQTMMLAACEKGFGACILASFKEDAIRKTLSLPDGMTPLLLIGLGIPEQKTVLCETDDDGDTAYYRKEDGTHVVPKRHLEDILL